MGSSGRAAKINPLLGRTADVTINRKLGCRNIRHKNITYPVNIGYFDLEKNLGDRKHTVYIIGASNTSDTFSAKIIAVIRHMDSGKMLAVAAPEEMRYYEPEIRECLNFFERQYVSEYEFYYEKKCGVIAHGTENGVLKYLLVRNAQTNFIEFPDTDVQFGESEKESALRALIQKTGIAPEITSDFRTDYTVSMSSGAKKTSVFYTAEFTGSMPRVADESVADVLILTFEEAIRSLELPQDRIVLAEAHDNYEFKRKSGFSMQ